MLCEAACIQAPGGIVHVVSLAIGQLQNGVGLETRQLIVAPRARGLMRTRGLMLLRMLRRQRAVFRRTHQSCIGRSERLHTTSASMHAQRRSRPRWWHQRRPVMSSTVRRAHCRCRPGNKVARGEILRCHFTSILRNTWRWASMQCHRHRRVSTVHGLTRAGGHRT